MSEILIHSAVHALEETAKLLPFLFLAYLLMEYLEHHAASKMEGLLRAIGPAGPLVGALLGCIPQCGFSATAANLYAAGLVSRGTLFAVFLSTSDEALPLLLGHSNAGGEIGKLLLCKLLIGVAGIGFLTNQCFTFALRFIDAILITDQRHTLPNNIQQQHQRYHSGGNDH